MANFVNKTVVLVNIEEELKRSYLDYAMSVIIGRALPDVRDGLKPVHRRVLFAMNVLGNDWNKSYKKSARIVGDVIGKYHPHGDTAVYDTIVRMAQPFSLRYMLIDGQGNFGSIDGDSAAAMRYTEIRMSKIAHELLLDLEKETINYVLNYDGTEKIPDVMPTRIPNLLINGSSGIAVGMATNIPPHNLSEIIDGCLAFIDNRNIDVEQLMKYIPGPDFPTAGIIHGCYGIQTAYKTGRGKIFIRARTKIEIDEKTSKKSIIIYEIPYQVNKTKLMEKFSELIKDKRLEGISALRDESDKDGMRIVIEIKRDAFSEVILNNLYSLTQLQVSFGINMVALDHGQPKTMSLKKILGAFVTHRQEVVSRRTIFELKKVRVRIHIVEALIIAMINVDKIIKIIRQSLKPSDAKLCLMSHAWNLNMIPNILKDTIIPNSKVYNFSELQLHKSQNEYFLTEKQAQSILDLRLQSLTSLEHKKLLEEHKELLIRNNELINILNSEDQLIQVIREELIFIKNEYKDRRRTTIIHDAIDLNVDDLIPQEDVVVTLSYHGYVKYQPLKDYEAQKRGGKGKSATRIKEEDFIDCLLVTNTHNTILLFSSRGRTYWMKVHQLPAASRSSRGKPITNLLPLDINERITAILPVREHDNSRHVFMATAYGKVKKILIQEFSRSRNAGIISINLKKGDELIGVDLTDGNNEIMLFSSSGKVVRFQENQVRNMGRPATGVNGIKLSKGDKVVSLIVPRGKGQILTITEHGYGKRTAQEEYPTKSRSTQGVISIKVSERNGHVIGAVQVNECDQVMMITDVGTMVRTRVSEVSVIGRNTQGVILIRTSENEHVVALQCIVEQPRKM